jgi:predicted ester cyclase
MSADANERFDRRLYAEIWSRGQIAAIPELVAPNVVFDGEPLGVAGYTSWVTGFRTAFPDLGVQIEQQVADEQVVVSRLAWHGTNTGELLPHLLPGWSGARIAPTGKTVAWTSTTMHRVVDGRLVEGWLNADLLGLLLQLGVLSPPASGG